MVSWGRLCHSTPPPKECRGVGSTSPTQGMKKMQMVKRATTNPNPPLTWRPWNGPNGNLLMVMFTCSEGHLGRLNHDIAQDGTVTPSVQCPDPGCTFHENIQLEGWEGK